MAAKKHIRLASTYHAADGQAADPALPSFVIPSATREYSKQYANLYWLRLAVLRPRVLKRARALWGSLKMAGSNAVPQHVKRVLDVESGQLCYVIGTVYMDMALKPNVLEDLAREHYIAAPPPRRKFFSDNDEIMLEDESGRVRLVGDRVSRGAGHFVTGTIMAALGVETPSGGFEVVELCYAGLPPQPPRKEEIVALDGEWVALVSGLELGSGTELRAAMLAEWLLGDLGVEEDTEEAASVTRLVVAGNSIALPQVESEESSKPKRYGYDASAYSPKPTAALDTFLADILPSLPVDLMPGEFDATGPTMPQQPIHAAMLPNASQFEGLKVRTNPFWCDVGGASFLGNSGQPLDDIFKYLETEDRLGMAVQMLDWSHMAPTCPDTLWCYPFVDRDPFILSQCPHVFFIGNQPAFGTELVTGSDGQQCRVVLVPKFADSGEVVLINTKTLDCRVLLFGDGGQP